MTKIIAIGDPHFRIDNIPEVELFIDRIEALALEQKPDFIVCLGDLLHTHERIHTIPLNKAYDFIRRMSVVAFTYVLVGNHDYIQNQQFLTENHWMNAMKDWSNVCVVDKVVNLGQDFIFCPYVPNGRFIEALETNSDIEWKKSKYIFAHQEFYGCSMGAIVSVDGDKWDPTHPLVISGHIHSKQQPQPNIYYTGSALQHAFGESEKNIIACISTNGDSYTIDEVDLKLPRKKIVYLNMDQVETYKLPSESTDDVKLTLSGTYEDFKAFKKTETFKALSKEGAKIVFKADKKVAPGIETKNSNTACDFKSILRDLVMATHDSVLYNQYELVVNNRKQDEHAMTLLL